MNSEQLKKLEDDLWDSANTLRAYGGIKAADYAVPVLGLIFLRFADNKYRLVESEIINSFERDKGSRMERSMEEIAIEKCGFYLPPEARYDYLLDLPGDKKAAQAIKEAMELIEKSQDTKFQGILPKDAYFNIEAKKSDILTELLRTFSDIPEDASGDVFGKIYEYFLGKFALSEGQKGGEFFTPTSVVRFIVEAIEPYKGKIFDPACGSGGMFVQSAKFLQEVNHDLSDIYVHGQEFMGETVRLAKMNLLVNNIRGEIAEVNSYEANPFESYGKFDYVMANPPFNVKTVKASTVKADKRFNHYGLSKTKSKKDDKITDANYLWISLFATSLNETGRAGFVMANSASDGRNAEYEIRKKMVDRGIVDCMVTMPSNMFYTVTLPATLWFLDKGKAQMDCKDKILFIDARDTYRQIDRAHREWTEEHIQNLVSIVRLYRGETDRYLELIAHYIQAAKDTVSQIPDTMQSFHSLLTATLSNLKTYEEQSQEKRTDTQKTNLDKSQLVERISQLTIQETLEVPPTSAVDSFDESRQDNAQQKQFTRNLKGIIDSIESVSFQLNSDKTALIELLKESDKQLKVRNDKGWNDLELNKAEKELSDAQDIMKKSLETGNYWYDQLSWLQSKFPDAQYADVVGLCKVADHEEYAEEQDYSLNAGRYVGVVIEDDNTTEEEFRKKIFTQKQSFVDLCQDAMHLEKIVIDNLSELII